MAKQAGFEPIIPAHSRALTPSKRKRIESRIEELIAVLDAQDAPIEDLEPSGDDEPDNDSEGSLGWPEDVNQDRALKVCTNDDAGVIFGPDREGDDADSEPSLGSLGCTYDADYFDQRGWARGAMHDAEGDEHDGREPDEADNEPELGWPEQVNQERALKTCSGYANFGGDQWVAVNDGEPSLGSLDGQINQAKWCGGNRRDLEEQCEDEGAEEYRR